MVQRTILEVIVGSTVHGCAVKDGLEDLDLMTIVIEDLPTAFGFQPQDTWTERTKPQGVRSEAGDIDRTVYGLKKFIRLALAGNPSILLGFFVPPEFTKHKDVFGHTLQGLYPRVVSKQMYKPFRGYMKQQHERLLGLRGQRNITRPELVDAYGYDTKYASYIIRLGLQGAELLTTGKLTLPMPTAEAELVMAARKGHFTLLEISQEIIRAEDTISKAMDKSTIREFPHYDFMQTWMLRAYNWHWSQKEGEPDCL